VDISIIEKKRVDLMDEEFLRRAAINFNDLRENDCPCMGGVKEFLK
jgi:hypothetical protein